MKIVERYQTSDGKLFEGEKAAKDHQEDIIGELLDDLLENDDRGNLTRSDRFNILSKMLKNPSLKKKINTLAYHLNFDNESEE